MTRTGRAARLGQHIAEPFAEIHPEDAAARGIAAADLVEVTSPHGRALVRALVTDRVRPGTVFVPMHWSGAFASRARVDALVPGATDPHSGQPALKAGSAEVRRHAAAWHGFAVSRRRPAPATDYWAIAPTPFGWRVELADAAPPDDWAAFARATFAAPVAEIVRCEDRGRGSVRIALVEAGRVTAALFAAAEPVEVARAHVVAAFETDAPPSLLAGRPGAAQEDRGAIVCACFDVGINDHRQRHRPRRGDERRDHRVGAQGRLQLRLLPPGAADPGRHARAEVRGRIAAARDAARGSARRDRVSPR